MSFPSVMIHLVPDARSTLQIFKKKHVSSPVKVVQRFHEAGFMVDLSDDQGATLNKKIRSAQLAQYNYIFGKNE